MAQGEFMNAGSKLEDKALKLVDIVDLKWMLAGEGLHVHVERLQTDPTYATECLRIAERSRNPTLRHLAASLRLRLQASTVR